MISENRLCKVTCLVYSLRTNAMIMSKRLQRARHLRLGISWAMYIWYWELMSFPFHLLENRCIEIRFPCTKTSQGVRCKEIYTNESLAEL